MGRRTFSEDFRQSAVKLVTEQGYRVAEADRSLGVRHRSLRQWKLRFEARNGPPSSEGEGAELRRLREENRRLRMEREILKTNDGLLRQGSAMRFAFIEHHRRRWPPSCSSVYVGNSAG